jgi:hypothetical protein
MKKIFVTCALAAMCFAVVPQTLMASTGQCPLGNATLRGTYVVFGGGTIAQAGLVTSVGEVTYDGKGNSNATYTVSVNGNVQAVTVAGTYAVNSDCTATAVESPSHFNFVVAPDGNTVWWMATDSGTVLSGTLVRLKPPSDNAMRLRGKE